MADEKIGGLYVELEARTKKLEKQLKTSEKKSKQAGKKAGKGFSNSFNSALVFAGAAVALRKLSQAVSKVVDQAKQQILAETKVRAGIKATGGVAGKTTSELKKMASQLQRLTGIGDETILSSVQAQLLTFTKIRGDIFDGLAAITLDINQVVNDGSIQSLTSLSIQLGKALNDPVANLGALGRMGIQFSKAQKATIKDLANSNRLYDAQSIILKELETQYGGQAKAAADALGGTKQLSAALSDYTESFGLGIVKIFTDMAGGISEAIDFIEDQSRRVKEFFGIIDEDLAKEARDNVAKAWKELFKQWDEETITDKLDEIGKEWEKLDNLIQQSGEIRFGDDFIKDTKKQMDDLLIQAEVLQEILNPTKVTPKTVVTGSGKVVQSGFGSLGVEGRDPSVADLGTTTPKELEGIKFVSKELDQAGSEFDNDLNSALSTSQSIAYLLGDALGEGAQNFVNILQSGISIASQVLGIVASFVPGGSIFSLFAHSGGTFQGGKKVASYAGGGDFIVPNGFPNDTYPIMVESGERVQITPTSGVGQQEKALNRISTRIDVMAANMGLNNDRGNNEGTLNVIGEISGTDIFLSNKKTGKIQEKIS